MKNRKQNLKNEVERQAPVELCEPGMGNVELKAGSLANLFSKLDPNTSVYTAGDGSFAIHASDKDLEALANEYCEDGCVQHFDNDEFEPMPSDSFSANLIKHEPKAQYGDATNIDGYVSDDFGLDNIKMDADITTFITTEQCRMMRDISEIAAAHTAYMIDNLIDYQNAKNRRTMIEIARVVK